MNPPPADPHPQEAPISLYEKIYLLLAGIFISALVISNVIAAKFFDISVFGHSIRYSVGIFAYPITFLTTDIISEIYGKKRANYIVVVGFAVSLFTLAVITLGGIAPPSEHSPLTQESYEAVFKFAPRILFASMVAYLFAQFVDIQVFHFWKRLTRGRHLWLRNNGSTLFSQLVDTSLVVVLTHLGTSVPGGEILNLIIYGYLIKAAVALFDTPFFYLSVILMKRVTSPAVGRG